MGTVPRKNNELKKIANLIDDYTFIFISIGPNCEWIFQFYSVWKYYCKVSLGCISFKGPIQVNSSKIWKTIRFVIHIIEIFSSIELVLRDQLNKHFYICNMINIVFSQLYNAFNV